MVPFADNSATDSSAHCVSGFNDMLFTASVVKLGGLRSNRPFASCFF